MPWRTKQSGGKLLPYSELRGRVFAGEASRRRQRGMNIGTWNVRSLYRTGPLKTAARELVLILGWISRRWDVGIWTGLSWLRIETGGGRLWVR